jgi:hypothetical protein
MKIGPFGLWMLATLLVGGTFVYTQISPESNLSQTAQAEPVINNKTEEESAVQNKWSIEEFERIKQNPPFKLILPNGSILSESELTGAYMSKIEGGGTNDKRVDLYYKTPDGSVSISQTNMKEIQATIRESHEKIQLRNQEWNYDKDLNMFFSYNIDGLQVHISGKVPKEQLLRIIKSFNTNN